MSAICIHILNDQNSPLTIIAYNLGFKFQSWLMFIYIYSLSDEGSYAAHIFQHDFEYHLENLTEPNHCHIIHIYCVLI